MMVQRVVRQSQRGAAGVLSTSGFLPLAMVLGLMCLNVRGGTLTGAVRDLNWFAQYEDQRFGVGRYEYAVNASGIDSGGNVHQGGAATDVFGQFSMSVPGGTYQVASWDVWWRPAFAFDVTVPARTASAPVDLRLGATMWGYPAFWDDAGHTEFGQTFVATGPLSMIMLRCPKSGRNLQYTLTVHEGGVGGPQVGESRFFGEGDQRPIYGWAEMPTAAGRLYYVRVRCATPRGGVVMQMDPRPDNIDPMPGGCLYLGDGATPQAYPDRDLGVILMADDDGLLTNWHARGNGNSWSGTSVGQSFVARGTSLVAAGFWLADPNAPTYVVQLYADGPGGEAIGSSRFGRPARLSADPELMVVWAPGACPLVPGRTYYLEVTRFGGGTFNVAYVNTGNPYAFGRAYRNGSAVMNTDLAGLTMEEASPGSALAQTASIIEGPEVREEERGVNEFTVRWRTDEPAYGLLEVSPGNPPYVLYAQENTLNTEHAVRIGGLQANTLHHYRARTTPAFGPPVVSRDHVTLTRADRRNLLSNPGFESGSGGSPRKPVPGWITGGSSLDIGASDGSWFWGLPPHEGGWLLEGAVNGGTADGFLAQRVAVSPGKTYTFSAWVTTWMRENDTWKYDVWNNRGRLSWVRLGLDPSGGVDPDSSTVRWTPRFYCHLRYTAASISALASGSQLTAFVQMKGSGGEWHLFGVDECVLTEQPPALPQVSVSEPEPGGMVLVRADAEPGVPLGLQFSDDLVIWQTWTNQPAPEGWIEWQDPSLSERRQRFYRAVLP
jgi:hypothetical protein